jgi:hypothetical protein
VKKTPYTFTVIRYVHDKGAGEALNVGVLVCAPESGYVGVRVESRFERLSKTFSGFDGDVYRQTLNRLTESVKALNGRFNDLPLLRESPSDAIALLRTIWPDRDLSFQASPLLSGVTRESLEDVLAELFDRMVTSQAPHKEDTEHRSDEEVWATYQTSLRRAKISHLLAPKLFTTSEFQIEFDHAFQNSQWHVVQPVTMDFMRAESLQDKATRWLGNASALEGHPSLGTIYLLLGEPRDESHRPAYDRAKSLLHRMKVHHELIEERDADAFASFLADYMREHGIATPE